MSVNAAEIMSLVKGADVSADLSKIVGNTRLRDAGIDSLDMMNVLLVLEEHFRIKIPDDDVASLDTVDNILRYLDERVG